MSITAIRNIIEKPGCYIGASVVMLLGIVAGSFSSCSRGSNSNQPSDVGKQPDVLIAQLGDFRIGSNDFEQGVSQELLQYQDHALTPDVEAGVRGRVLAKYVTNGLATELLTQHKITVTDEQLTKALHDQVSQKLMMDRFQRMQSGDLKPNATPKEVDDYYKAKVGKTPKEIEDEEMATAHEKLKDPAIRAGTVPSIGFQSLIDIEAKKITPTDAQIKKEFQSFTFKKIVITPKTAGGMYPSEKAKKILAEIKGGLSFESAMDKYSDDQPAPKKQIHENTETKTYDNLVGVPAYKSLLELKPGGISPIIPEAGGVTIYKFVEIKANVPKDFTKNRAQYATQAASSEAKRQAGQELTDLRKTAKIDWKSSAYHAMYDYQTAAMDPDLDKAGRISAFRKALDEAKKETNQTFKRAADLVIYLASDSIYAASSSDEQKKLTDEQIQAMTQVLQSYESADIRVRLAEAYAEKKDASNTFTQLLTAAQRNSSLDPGALATFNKINGDATKYQKQGLINADQSKQIADVFDTWRKQYTAKELEDLKQVAEKAKFEKQQADAQKKALADQKRVTAEQKKAEADKKKAGAPAVPPGTSNPPAPKKGK